MFTKLGLMGTMVFALSAQAAGPNPLIGCWSCEGGESAMPLRFTATHYIIDDEPLGYRLVPGAIEIPEPDGFSNYPYELSNGALTIHVGDIPPLLCTRTTCPEAR